MFRPLLTSPDSGAEFTSRTISPPEFLHASVLRPSEEGLGLAAKEKGWKVADQNGDEYNGIIIAGDANGDGEVTAADVEAISDYILGRLAPDSWFDEESADVVDDGVVDIQDLTQLIQLLTE